MKQLGPLSSHLADGTTTLAWCWRITRADDEVLGFTDHDRPLSFDGTSFESESGLVASEVRSGSDLSVDAQDAEGVLSSDRITETDILDGRWDNASVEVWRVNWQDTSDDVTHDGQPISQILDRIDAENTFYLQDYLHPDDMTAVIAGNTGSQNGARVTAAINLCLEEALAAMFAVNGASVIVDFAPGIYRINNRLMSDAFNTALWNAPAMSRSRMRFRTSGAVTFRVQNWVPGRASMRTDGIYAGSAHIAHHAVFEWFQRSGFQNFGGKD